MSGDISTRQEVNLYTLEFRRGDQAFSASYLLKACALFFMCLLVVEALIAWQFFENKKQLVILEEQQQNIAQRLSVLKQSQVLSQKPNLQQQADRLQDEIKRRNELLSILSGQNFGNFKGFSPFLTTIAKQAKGDLSLSHIQLIGGGSYLELEGWAKKPEAVPNYLLRLRTEDSFEKVRFGVLRIEKSPDLPNKLFFSLGRQMDDPT